MVASDFVILGSDPDRTPSMCGSPVDEQLLADGWVRRNWTDANRAKESIELYESLGFEVRTREPSSADYDPKCRECIASSCPSMVLIYTRKKN